MRKSHQHGWTAALAIAVMIGGSACPQLPGQTDKDPTTEDAGGHHGGHEDGGVTNEDGGQMAADGGGTGSDGGETSADAGTGGDGGTTNSDGGITGEDGGMTTGDGGMAESDGGAGETDAGPWQGIPVDAGVLDPVNGEWDSTLILPGFAGEFATVTALAKAPGGEVYAAGDFVLVDGTPAQSVARWDGTRWLPVGDGLPWPASALAIAGDGTVYAAGGSTGFFFSGGVVRWDGSTWTELATFDMPVNALLIDGTTVYAGGGFTNVDGLLTQDNTGVAADGLAKLENDVWSAVGDAPGTWTVNAILKLDATTVCIGGYALSDQDPPPALDHVACFDGNSWSTMGNGLPGEVLTLVRGPDSAVYAGGTFVYFDETTFTSQTGLARLENGTWSPWAGGVGGGFVDTVRSIAFNAQGEALVGGAFAGVGVGTEDPVDASNIARLDVNGEWHALGDGVRGRQGGIGGGPMGVHAILPEADGTIWIGGLFNRAGDVITLNLVKWGGSGYVPVKDESRRFNGVQGFIDGLAPYGHSGLVAGGNFSSIGGVVTSNIALQREGTWEPLGPGLNGTVFAVHTARNGDIYAGGEFTSTADDVLFTPGFARWNRSTETWESLGEFDGPVLAIVEDHDGVLYVAGQFEHIGLDPVAAVARYNPNTSAFEQVAAGLSNRIPASMDEYVPPARVTALAVGPDNTIYAGGMIARSGTTTIRALAQLKGGGWEEVATGLDGADGDMASTLVWTAEGLLVGGNFSSVGGVTTRSLALWTGTEWRGFNPGLSASFEPGTVVVQSIAPFRDGFFVTGIIDNAGDEMNVGHVAYWDGSAWHPLGRGLNDLAEALAVIGDSLYVGGTFTTAGDFPSEGLARWVMPQAAP